MLLLIYMSTLHFPWTSGELPASTEFDPWISPGDPEAIPHATEPRAFKNCPPGAISTLVLPLISFLLSFSHSVVQAEEPGPSQV